MLFERSARVSEIEPLRAEVRGSEQAAEIRVALRCLSEQNQLAAIGQRDRGAGDCLNTEWLGRVRERERAVDAVAIGEREGGIAVAMRFGENLIRRRGAVEEGIGGVAMQLGVHQGIRASARTIRR